ncbi:MAG: D-hexose-6-phosphate mutarotase [Gammaproteobacteria bacterium]|nr:MAG: D-hexose-6-phosphate mutarotase [Gammaproteobacteria bacterium]
MDQLNNQYGIKDELVFELDEGGLTKVVVTNALAEAEIYLQGGQLTHFKPTNALPVIWMSEQAVLAPGKAIRGGVPICWPWFGPHATDNKLPQHGFARTADWSVIFSASLSNGSTRLCLGLQNNDASYAFWPHSFKLVLEIIVDQQLQLALTATNTDNKTVELGAAFHTYFTVGDSSRIHISGLGGRDYLDKPDGYARKQQQGDITIAGELDRIYLDTSDDCVIHDSLLKRKIIVSKKGSASTIVWNPWIEKAGAMADFDNEGYQTMVCIESANAADDIRLLAPGGSHTLVQRIAIA